VAVLKEVMLGLGPPNATLADWNEEFKLDPCRIWTVTCTEVWEAVTDGEVAVGSQVRVLQPFVTNDASKTYVNAGLEGVVEEIDLSRQRLPGIEYLVRFQGEVKTRRVLEAQLSNLQVLTMRVTKLRLPFEELKGSIHASIGQLLQLTALILDNNQLTGSIPASIGQLLQLTVLDLGNNQLTGSIPASMGQLLQLTRLDLRGNYLTGDVPMSLLRLHKLVLFRLGESLLPAGVPTSRNCAPLQKDPCRVLRVIDVEKSLFCVALALLAAAGLAFVRLWRCSSAHIAVGAQQTNLGSMHLAQMAASPGSPMAFFYVCLAVVAQSIWPTLLLWSIVTAELAALHIGFLALTLVATVGFWNSVFSSRGRRTMRPMEWSLPHEATHTDIYTHMNMCVYIYIYIYIYTYM
jgi:hypothetical protein